MTKKPQHKRPAARDAVHVVGLSIPLVFVHGRPGDATRLATSATKTDFAAA